MNQLTGGLKPSNTNIISNYVAIEIGNRIIEKRSFTPWSTLLIPDIAAWRWHADESDSGGDLIRY
jgi:hypothetical protein